MTISSIGRSMLRNTMSYTALGLLAVEIAEVAVERPLHAVGDLALAGSAAGGAGTAHAARSSTIVETVVLRGEVEKEFVYRGKLCVDRSATGSCRGGNCAAPVSPLVYQEMCLRATRDAGIGAVEIVQLGQMRAQHLMYLVDTRRRQFFSGREEMLDLAKDPRPALRRAADHQRVDTGAHRAPAAPFPAKRCRRWR
jgi:hypothetical protein